MTLLHDLFMSLLAVLLVCWPLVFIFVVAFIFERLDGTSRLVIKDGKVRLRRCVEN